MTPLISKLKKVPAISKEELFLYVFDNSPDTILQIVTHSGCAYSGCVINTGITREEGRVVVIQNVDKNGNLIDRVLHLAINKIESVELISKKEIINILSKGKVTEGEQYEASGKLEVKRGMQQLSENILKTYGVNIGIPEINLPEDGIELNRILKLSKTIFQAISELFTEADALASWKIKYNSLVFGNSEVFELTGKDKVLHIHFPFNDIDSPLIDIKELKHKLMAVL